MKHLIRTVVALCAAILVTGSVMAGSAMQQSKEDRNRAVARAFYDTLYSRDNAKAIEFIDPSSYTEHQISANYSLEGLLSYARGRVTDNADHYNVIHRTIAQGDLVFLHVEERLTDTDSVARGELFRFSEAGQIVEHWGAEQPAIDLGNNNNGYFIGSEVNRASQSGRKYAKELMENDITLFRNLDVDLIYKTRTDRYIQHNPGVANGPDGLKAFIEYMKAEGVTVEARIEQLVAEGDYVVALNYFKTTPGVKGFSEVVVFDLIRITEDGKTDEHWDVVQELNGQPVEPVF